MKDTNTKGATVTDSPPGGMQDTRPPQSAEKVREWNEVWKAGYDAALRDADAYKRETDARIAALEAEIARLRKEDDPRLLRFD